MKRRYLRLASIYSARGPLAIDRGDREQLAVLFVHEVTKGAFLISGKTADTIQADFGLYLHEEFAMDPEPMVALDFGPTLIDAATATHTPLVACILFATWIEHWVNGLILSKALGRGKPHDEAVKVIAWTKLPARLGRVWTEYSLPMIPDEIREEMAEMARTRNSYVHYDWAGRSPDAVRDPTDRLRVAAQTGRGLIERLVSFELDSIRAEEIAAATILFDVPVRQILWRRALPEAA